FADIAQSQAGQRHPELCSREISVQMRSNVFGKAGSEIAFFNQSVQLTTSNFYNSEFASNKKPVERNQTSNHDHFPENNEGRTPLVSHRRSDCERKMKR